MLRIYETATSSQDWETMNACINNQKISTMAKTTWKPHTTHGELSTQDKNDLPETVFLASTN